MHASRVHHPPVHPRCAAGSLAADPAGLPRSDRAVAQPRQDHAAEDLSRGDALRAGRAAQTGSKSTHWDMVAPVEAPADEEAITKMVMLLSTLTAEGFVTDQIGDGKAFGFHAPSLTVTWTTPAEATADQVKSRPGDHAVTETGTLRIGKKVPRSDLSYANIEGSPIVFTLCAAAIDPFEAEFHTHRAMAFPKASARRLVLHWPVRTLAFKPQQDATGKGILWVPETTADTKGLDLTRLATLVETMANLNTPRFVQYRGPIPDSSGLAQPRLVIEVDLASNKKRQPPARLLEYRSDLRHHRPRQVGAGLLRHRSGLA